MKRLALLLTLLSTATLMAEEKAKVLFMCPYGGAKSVIAAEYFNRAAAAKHLSFVAIAAAAEEPYEAVPEKVAEHLAKDGIDVRNFKPRHVAADDLRNATRVVSIDCDLSKLDTQKASIEKWDDVPKVSVDLPASAAAIRKHVDKLVDELSSKSCH